MHLREQNAQVRTMRLNLSCIDLSVEDLLRCSFGLSKGEVLVLQTLLQGENWSSTSRISSIIKRDRSVVQRGLASLKAKGLIEREQSNKEGGGFEYLYRAKDKGMIKRSILGKARAFGSIVKQTVSFW